MVLVLIFLVYILDFEKGNEKIDTNRQNPRCFSQTAHFSEMLILTIEYQEPNNSMPSRVIK